MQFGVGYKSRVLRATIGHFYLFVLKIVCCVRLLVTFTILCQKSCTACDFLSFLLVCVKSRMLCVTFGHLLMVKIKKCATNLQNHINLHVLLHFPAPNHPEN